MEMDIEHRAYSYAGCAKSEAVDEATEVMNSLRLSIISWHHPSNLMAARRSSETTRATDRKTQARPPKHGSRTATPVNGDLTSTIPPEEEKGQDAYPALFAPEYAYSYAIAIAL